MDHRDDDGLLAELRAVGSVERLQQLLLVRSPGWGPNHPDDPVTLFRQYHQSDATGAADTALLLVTASRWDRHTGRVIAGIEACGILDDADLDGLARQLLGPNDPDIVFPARWLTEHFGEAMADPDASVRSERRPRPPLRRWAADRCLRRHVVTAGQALKIARRLRDDHRWALIAGGLDAADALPERDVECFIDAALSSGKGPLRLRGLRLLADRGDRERAVERARSDGDAKVRGWARQQEQQDQGAERDAVRGAGGSR